MAAATDLHGAMVPAATTEARSTRRFRLSNPISDEDRHRWLCSSRFLLPSSPSSQSHISSAGGGRERLRDLTKVTLIPWKHTAIQRSIWGREPLRTERRL